MGFQCGYVSILGRPNVGKSTLLNQLIEQKISITSRKPNTTQSTLLGIKSDTDAQIIYLDTPGFSTTQNKAFSAKIEQAINDAEVLVFVITACHWKKADATLLMHLKQHWQKQAVILVVNKIDRVHDKTRLLPFLDKIQHVFDFSSIIPLSARKGTNLAALISEIKQHLPEQPAAFKLDQLTDRDERFLITEFIRGKIMRILGEELPYSLSVSIEKYQQHTQHVQIDAIIWVDNKGQKQIAIGQQGERLKAIGSQARRDIEHLLQQSIYLGLWVKVRKNHVQAITKPISSTVHCR